MGQQELAVTRRSLHGVAELVLAGPQYRATGRLRLRVVPGGFATTLTPGLRVDGSRIVRDDGVAVAVSGRTARALGAELEVAAGRPEGAYEGGSGVAPDEVLALDLSQAGVIIGALALGQDALTAFAPGESPVLWPEHFDVAIRVQDMNFGVSPGDGFIEEPYAYVGVSPLPAGDPFWNFPFGAAVPLRELAGVPAVTGFFAEGRERASRLGRPGAGVAGQAGQGGRGLVGERGGGPALRLRHMARDASGRALARREIAGQERQWPGLARREVAGQERQ